MPTVCEKINALENHVLTRQLRVAQALGERFTAARRDDALSESGFVILNVGLAYFEMIEQFESGETSVRRSGDFFKRGFNRVYPASSVSPEDVSRIWKSVRNGMYHVAMPTDRCGLSRHLGCAFAIENGALVINPAKLIDDLIAHFSTYCQELRDGGHCQLQKNFERMFDRLGSDAPTTSQPNTSNTPVPYVIS